VKNKRIKLGAVLAIMLLAITMSTVPLVIAEKNEEKVSPNYSDQKTMEKIIKKLTDADDKYEEEFAKLTPEAQSAVLDYLTVSKVKHSEVVSSVGCHDGCDSRTYEEWGENIFGVKLWSYFQTIDWCYDGSKVTSKTRLRWGEVHTLGWKYNGHIGNTESGGVDQLTYRAWTQGSFDLCLGGDIGCIQSCYPWIDQTVYGTGVYSGWGDQ
jgi:hypothetical protein